MIYTKESEDLSFKESEPSFDYDLQSYYVIGPLGRGACGFVYRIENFKTKKQFALKVIDKKEKNYNHIEKRLRKEIKIQQELDHPNIIRLLKHFEDEQNYYLLMELGLNGELQGLLKERGKLNEKEIVDITFQLASGLKYLHDKDIIHRDLKLQNILLSGEIIKIADFGLSTKVTDDSPECFSLCGTPNYISPEIVNSQSYGKKTDIWSFGCILYALCTGSPPFMGDSVIKTIQNVKDGSLKLPNTISANLKDLLLNTINWDSSSRFSIEQVIHHQFYAEKYSKSIITFDSAESHKILSEEEGGKLPLKVLPFDWTSPRFSIVPAHEKQLEQHRNNCSPSNKENISSFCNIIQQSQQANNKLNSTATLKSLGTQNKAGKYSNTHESSMNSQVFSMTARSIRSGNNEKQDLAKSNNSKSTQRLVNYLSSSQTGRQASISPQSRQTKQSQQQQSVSYQPTPVSSKEKYYQSASTSSNQDTKQHKDKSYLVASVARQEKQTQHIKSSRSVSYLDSNRVTEQTSTAMRQPHNRMQNSISQHSVSSRFDNNNNSKQTQSQTNQQHLSLQTQNKSQQLISSLGQESKTNNGYLLNNYSYSSNNTNNAPLNGYSSLNNTARQSKLIQKQQQSQQQFGECLKRHASEIIPVSRNQLTNIFGNGSNSKGISQQKEITKNHNRSKNRTIDQDRISPKKLSSKSARNSIISDEQHKQQNQLEGVKSETKLHTQSTHHVSSKSFKSFSHNTNNLSRNNDKENQWDRINQLQNKENDESKKRCSVRDQSPIDLGSEELPEGTTSTHSSNGLPKNEPNCNNTSSPLSTKYLKPNRVATKNGFIEIQEDRWLSIECQNGSLIFKISPDGINIQIEKYIKNKCSRKDYSLYSLPAKYVQLYEYAKVVCTTLKSKIPLVKITNDHGTFMLMRNKPKQNYEVQLLNGCRVSHAIGTDKMLVKDVQGKEYQIHLIEHQSNVVYPLEVTQAVKLSLEYLTECLQKQNQKYLASFN